ncbi:unnamed protein product [Rhizophagus irregularis]|nr:unnamed protein product [Rhizophagus irregularis]
MKFRRFRLHLKELRRFHLSFERTSKVPDFHLEELRRLQLPFERTSKVPGSHLAHFKDPGISCQTFRK